MGATDGTEFTQKIWIFFNDPFITENAEKIPKRAHFFTFSAKFVPTSIFFFVAVFAVKSSFNVSGI